MAKNDAMKALQEKCGCTPDGAFGPNTARAIAKHYDLSPNRAAHLLGQASHESGGFTITKENLYYSNPERICKIWPSRFKTVEDAAPYAKNPTGLADKVYSNRMGNGENEGHLWIGRGFLQLTGKENYRSFAADMRVPEVLTDPSRIEKDFAFETALWFFKKNKLFEIADNGVGTDTIKIITKRVNGGYHGLDDRIAQTQKIYGWLS
ncbi:MAG: glycoside hydrolase family 19 protein [Alphaproteobacteria bacterium]